MILKFAILSALVLLYVPNAWSEKATTIHINTKNDLDQLLVEDTPASYYFENLEDVIFTNSENQLPADFPKEFLQKKNSQGLWLLVYDKDKNKTKMRFALKDSKVHKLDRFKLIYVLGGNAEKPEKCHIQAEISHVSRDSDFNSRDCGPRPQPIYGLELDAGAAIPEWEFATWNKLNSPTEFAFEITVTPECPWFLIDAMDFELTVPDKPPHRDVCPRSNGLTMNASVLLTLVMSILALDKPFGDI